MDYILQIIILSVIYGIVAVSCNFILGYGGMATMCHAALWGIGGYTSALIAMHYGANFIICLIAAMMVSAVFGFVLSCPTLKIRDVYLILFTMAFQIIFTGLVFSQHEITGGDSGLINIPRIDLLGMKFFSPQSHLPLVFILAGIFVLASWHIARSAFGRVLKCIREDEVITQSLGKNVIRFKVLTFTIGSAIAGAAGSIYAHYNAILNPTSFDVNASILLVAMVIIGGGWQRMGFRRGGNPFGGDA